MKPVGELQEFQKVDDLVVAPVADVAPGIVRLLDFPVDPLLADPVGVVAVYVVALRNLAITLSTNSGKLKVRASQF